MYELFISVSVVNSSPPFFSVYHPVKSNPSFSGIGSDDIFSPSFTSIESISFPPSELNETVYTLGVTVTFISFVIFDSEPVIFIFVCPMFTAVINPFVFTVAMFVSFELYVYDSSISFAFVIFI